MWIDVVVLALSLGVILLGAELFTNSIEWLGHHLNLSEGVVGSILAAVGTAMPETLIPVVAILFSNGAQGHAVGIGAILGAPFMLSTLAMFVTGFGVLIFSRRGQRGTELNVNVSVLSRDMNFFFIAYVIAIGAVFLPAGGLKVAVAGLLVAVYAVYIWRHLTDVGMVGDDLNPLHFARVGVRVHARVRRKEEAHVRHRYYRADSHKPRLRVTGFQVLVGLALIVLGARVFVTSTGSLATSLGVPAMILALLIAPIATELPEKFNSVLWVRQGKDTLALGNITGAMVFQSCLPAALGVALTSWSLAEGSASAFGSAGVALLSSAIIFGVMRLRGRLSAFWLITGLVWYLAYVIYLLFGLGG